MIYACILFITPLYLSRFTLVAEKLNEIAHDKFGVLLTRLFQKLHLKVRHWWTGCPLCFQQLILSPLSRCVCLNRTKDSSHRRRRNSYRPFFPYHRRVCRWYWMGCATSLSRPPSRAWPPSRCTSSCRRPVWMMRMPRCEEGKRG